MKRIVWWFVQKYSPVEFAIVQDHHGNWRVALVRGHLKLLNTKFPTADKAVRLYRLLNRKEIISEEGS